ncbi:MAG TPA: HEAT repeat domain-containing protein, partial [bacterium]|nr:HEAT repeat domain-containing protein [bacterium]
EVLIPALDTYDEDTQSNILLALGEAKLPESRAKILPLVKSAVTGKGDWVRIGAIGALGLIKDTTTLPLIEAALEDPVDEVREIAVGVLAQMKGETMVDRLKAWAKDDQYSMRSVALAGLGSLRDPVIVEKTVYPVLYNTMKFDPEMMVRVRAAFTLLNIINDRKYTKGI